MNPGTQHMHSMATAASEIDEARRLLDALSTLIVNVGEAYVESSGQTAATQAVVADLRRCGSFLSNRLVGEPPPSPWLAASARIASSSTSPAATPPARRPSQSQEVTPPASRAAPGGSAPDFRSPPPAQPSAPGATASGSSPAMSGSAAGAARPSAPCTPAHTSPAAAPAAAAVGSVSARPALWGGSSAAGSRAGSVGRPGPAGRPPVSGARNPASLPAAGRPSGAAGASRTRDPSPQRRAGGAAAPAAAAAAAAGLRSASPAAAATPQVRGVPQLVPSKAPGGTAEPGQGQGHANGTDDRGGDIAAASHLPPAAQRAMAAAAAMAGAGDGVEPQHQADAPLKPVGPPQLPLALRRAMQRYRETLQTRDQLLRQSQQRKANCSAAGGSSGLADMVATAGRAYRSALARQYSSMAQQAGACESGGGGSGSGAYGSTAVTQMSRLSLGSLTAAPGTPPSASELRRRSQVVFGALVAAQTWLIQSLSELARSRGTPGGVAAANRRAAQADTCAALLTDVQLLRLELGDLQEQIRAAPAAEAAHQPGAPAAAGTSLCGHVGSCRQGALTGVAVALEMDGEELEEAAALWRNRFLRALLCDATGGGGPAGGGGRRANPGPGGLQRAAPPAPQQQPPGLNGQLAGDGSLASMRRPLGFWLPDTVWAHLPLQEDGTAAAAGRPGFATSQSPATPSGGRQATATEPTWHVLLPPRTASVQALAPATGTPHLAAAPPALLCSSVHEAVAHGRAQLQLQATAFQLLLESSLAASLLPRQRPPQPPPQLYHHHHSTNYHHQMAATLAWERWLAQCRLAHLLLFKGAWNRLCSVVELETEEEAQEDDPG